jgi:non-ribosomal peptide synthetase component F
MNRLDNFPLVPLLPLKQNPSAIQKPHFKRQSKVFDKQSWDTLKRKAKERNVTPSALLCTAYAEVLAFWSNQTDFSINLTVFNRYPFHEDVNKIVGDVTSVLLIEISMKPLSSFWDKVREVQNTLLEALEHRHFDGIEFIRELSRKNNLGTKAAMPIVFTSALFNSEQDNQGFGVGDGVQKAGISQTSRCIWIISQWK